MELVGSARGGCARRLRRGRVAEDRRGAAGTLRAVMVRRGHLGWQLYAGASAEGEARLMVLGSASDGVQNEVRMTRELLTFPAVLQQGRQDDRQENLPSCHFVLQDYATLLG